MKTFTPPTHVTISTQAKTKRTLIALSVLVAGNLFTFISPLFTTSSQKINTISSFSKITPPFEKAFSLNKLNEEALVHDDY
jgi:hypothetical protein